MLRWFTVFLVLPFAASAASRAELAELHGALNTDALMQILSEEGLAQTEELRENMFPGRGGAGWTSVVQRIYAPERLGETFRSAFDAALADSDVAPLLEFYAGETGARVAQLELEARRAIMADEVEDAARGAWESIKDDDTPRTDLLREFAEVNDLVERNVMGALNSNLAFYKGLEAGGGFEMTESEMLSEVWSQAEDIRADTTGWVFGYMTFAYEPLSDADLRAYVEMSASDPGRDLNRALFAGFDAVFEEVSFALGQVTARFTVGDEL